MIEPRVLARVRHGPGIVVEAQNFGSAEPPRGERENSGASSGVEQSPAWAEIPRYLFQQTKRHRGGRVFASAERASRRNDQRRPIC